TLGEFRRCTRQVDEPRVLLLVDGVAAFRAEYEGTAEHHWWEVLVDLAARGRAVGVHVVVSGDRPASLSSALAAVVQRRLVLRLTSDVDLAMLGVPPGAIPAGAPPGRGWLDGREVQVAVPGGVTDVPGQARELGRLAEQIAAAPRGTAPAVGSLPSRVALHHLPPAVGDGLPVIGIVREGTFVVAGPPRSGRTTTIATIVGALTRVRGDVAPVLLGRRHSGLSGAADWADAGMGLVEIERLTSVLADRVAAMPTRR